MNGKVELMNTIENELTIKKTEFAILLLFANLSKINFQTLTSFGGFRI